MVAIENRRDVGGKLVYSEALLPSFRVRQTVYKRSEGVQRDRYVISNAKRFKLSIHEQHIGPDTCFLECPERSEPSSKFQFMWCGSWTAPRCNELGRSL